MTEAIIRQHRKCTDRWMPKKKRSVNWTKWRTAALFGAKAFPCCLLAFAEMLGIPSGLHGALGLACGALGMDVQPVLAGGAAAFLLRWVSGMPVRWESLTMLAAVWAGKTWLKGRGTLALGLFAAAAMLPVSIAGCLASTAAEMIKGFAAVAVTGLSAPIFARALKAIHGQKHMAAMEEQVAVGYLAAMCLCGGARLLFLGFNIGCWLSACAALAMALVLGPGAGAMTGMLAGAVLALQGIPLTEAVALSIGGLMAGVTNTLSRRRLSCGGFAMGAYLLLMLSGSNGFGCGIAVLGAALVMGLLSRQQMEWVRQQLRRFLSNDAAPGDAYAAWALAAWEQTVAAMAQAVPSPRLDGEERSGAWWQERLCQGCPEMNGCGCMTTELGVRKAEEVWACRQAREEVWLGALEHLRGMGCQRLYHLMAGMDELRREDESQQRVIRQAEAQRKMLVTHLTAMSGAARRFAQLSSGESWWDDMATRKIRREMEARAMPAALSYVRRVQGHVQAAFELQLEAGASTLRADLCLLVSTVLETPMKLAKIEEDRVLLTEVPLLQVRVGIAAEPITKGRYCGDTAWDGMLQDGRCLAALSDGMGHGEQAELASRQTVELLRLCLDAGYSRQQTLTAVNGMMLLGGGGERFATADVLTIDLWNGKATLDKLGAAASWMLQQGRLTRFTGNALPLGILEEIELTGTDLQLHAGDKLVLMTDGVEEAFGGAAALEDALRSALEEEWPQDAADALLASAWSADAGQRRDDQSAVVVYIQKRDEA